MSRTEYDVIVVGASFAGLAVARELRGDVLLLDRHEVGAVQTSACGTPLWVPRALGVEDSVLQVHQRLVVRGRDRTVVHELGDLPFCTFDYRAFCRGLLAQTRARFLRAGVIGAEGQTVVTSQGRFSAPVIVDCSGWRQAVIHGGRSACPRRGVHSFGLETRIDRAGDDLCLWFDEELIPRGLAWVFPAGDTTLVGVGSYRADSRLGPSLGRLLDRLAARGGACHGTYFPNRPLPATPGRVFAVGDAAGQCLPLTAEGIRPALYFGSECGRIIRRILDGALSLEGGLGEYGGLVARYRGPYRWLRLAQWGATYLPARRLLRIVDRANRSPFRERWWPRYGLFGGLGAARPAGGAVGGVAA